MLIRARKRLLKKINIGLNAVVLLFTFFPLYFLIVSSFKTNEQILSNYFWFSFPLHFENYSLAFARVKYYLSNSVVVCTASAIGVILLSSITAYVFAKREFPGKKALFLIILSFLMIPGVLTLVPQFVLIVKMGLIGTKLALILPYIAWGQIIFIFVLRTFIEGIPDDLFKSAKIDGANDFRVFVHVVLPLAKPIVIALALLNFLGNWNDFLWPLLVLQKEADKTVAVGLYAFTDVQQIKYGILFAGFVIASVPLVALFSIGLRSFVQGIASGAIKA